MNTDNHLIFEAYLQKNINTKHEVSVIKREVAELQIKQESSENHICIEDLAKKHNVSLDEITQQLEMGMKVEMEHTSDIEVAKKIALDHLAEDPIYYTKLQKMEKSENSEMPTNQFMSLKQFINKGPIKINRPSKELHSTDSKIHDLAKKDSREENAEDKHEREWTSMFYRTFGPGHKEEFERNKLDPYDFFVDYYSWIKHSQPEIVKKYATIYNTKYPNYMVDIDKLINMFETIKDKPAQGYKSPGKKSEDAEKEEEGDLMIHMKQKGMIAKDATVDTGRHGYTKEEEESRIDPKCWKGYHKQGTKLKGGVRVNNCVKN